MRNSEAIHWSRFGRKSPCAIVVLPKVSKCGYGIPSPLVRCWRGGCSIRHGRGTKPSGPVGCYGKSIQNQTGSPGVVSCATAQGNTDHSATDSTGARTRAERRIGTALRACRGTRRAAASPPSCSCAGARQGTARSSCCQPRTGRPGGPPSGRTSTAGRPGPRSPGEARP